jgi:hypothetical protein
LPEEVEKPVAAKIKELGDRFSPQAAPGYEDAIPTRLGEGLGSMLSTLAIPGGVVGRGLALGASGAGEARQRAQQEKATPEQISTATAQGIAPGLVDLLPIQFLLGGAGKVALTGLVSRGVRAATTGSVEGVTEAAQNIMQNAIAQGYKPEQGLYEGTGEAASYGGAVGAIAQGLMDLALPGRARRGQQPQREVAPPVVPEPVAPEIQEPPLAEPQLAAETPQAQPIEAAEAAAPVVAVAPEVKPVVAVAPEVTPGVITDSVIKDLGIKGYGSTNVKNTLRGVDLNTVEGQKTFDDTFTSAHKNLKYNADAVQAYRASVPNLYEAPSNDQIDAAATLKQPIKTTRVRPDGGGTGNVQLVSSDESKKPGAEAIDVARVGGAESTVSGLTGGKEALPDALTVESFVADRVAGKPQTSPEEIQFYQNNAEAIETALQKAAAPIEGKINKAKLGNRFTDKLKAASDAAMPLRFTDKLKAASDAAMVTPEPVQKTEVVAPEVIPPERQQKIAEYEQLKNAPKAAKDYYEHYGSIDESLKNLGFDLAEKTKKGEMGYAKEGGAPAQQFSDWIEKTGTPKQKVTLKKSQDEYAKLKAQAEDAVFVQRGVKQRDLEEAVRGQLEREREQRLLAAEKRAKQEEVNEPETETDADKADKAATAIRETAEKIIAMRGTKKSKGVDAKDTEAISKTEEAMLYAESTGETDEDQNTEGTPPRGVIRSSKGETTTATGNTKEDVTKALKNHFKEDSRFDALTTVVQSEKDLPDEIRQSKDYRAGTRGVAYKNKVFLVADNIQRGRELGVFLHEAGAHIGFDNVLKPSDRQFLADQVRKWAKGKGDAVETVAAKAALAKGGKSNDEIIAYMTEELVNRGVKPTSFRPANTWLRRVVEAFKKVMTKLGLRQDITPQELVDFANGAAHIAIKAPGKAVEGAPRFSTGNPTLDAAVGRRAEVLTKEGDKPLATRIANFFGGDKKQAAMKFRVQVDDNEASVKSKLLAAGDTEPLIHLAFASKATDTAVTSILHGALQLDPKTGAFHAVKGVSLSTVHEHIQSIAKKLDASNPKEAFDSASHIFDLGGNVLRERSLPKELQGRFKFSPADVQAGEEALRIYGKEIRAAMDAWTEYKNGMLDAGLKAGRFSKDDVTVWKEANDYVPWHRILDDAKYGYETKSSAREFFGNLQTRGKIKELVGGNVEDRPIGGLFNNMEQLSFWLGTTTIKNHTGIKVVDSLLKLDATKIGSPDAAGVDKARVVRVYRDGVPTYYELGNELDAYAFMGVEQDTSDWVKMMATGANWLRRGTTMMPGFVTSQLFQDSFRATAYSGAKSPFTVGAKVFSEYARELKGDALTQHLASYGIIGRPDNILGAEKGRIRNQLGESATGIGRAAKAAFSALDKLTHASDAAQRRSIYKQTLKETGNESLALYKAIEIINFQTRGANQKISTLRHIIPFMNAYIQGMSITLRSLAGHGITLEERSTAMKMFYATAVKIGALSLLYTMLVSDDEEYQNTPDHQKMTGFIIPGTRQMIKDMTGSDPGGNLKIPAPTDLVGLLFKTVPESTYNYVSRLGTKNEIDNTKFLRGLSSAAIQAISPPSAVPQAVKPVLEIWTNYDFFTGSPVVGRGLQHLEKDQQFTSSTTEFAKVLGKYLPMAPVQIDHFVRGVFGLAGGTTMFAASQIIDSFTPGERPSARLNEIPQIKTFLSGKATSGLKEDFYELRDKLTTVTTTVNRLKTRDPEYLKEYLNDNKKLYALHQSGIVAKVDKVLGELRAYRERIDSDKTMSAESKRKIFDDIEAREVQYLSMLNPSALRRISGL